MALSLVPVKLYTLRFPNHEPQDDESTNCVFRLNSCPKLVRRNTELLNWRFPFCHGKSRTKKCVLAPPAGLASPVLASGKTGRIGVQKKAPLVQSARCVHVGTCQPPGRHCCASVPIPKKICSSMWVCVHLVPMLIISYRRPPAQTTRLMNIS